jgi:hypothetical protein
MVSFPLLLIPLAIYNIIVFLMPGVSLEQPVVKVPLISGAEWPLTLGEMLLALGILLLLLELIKGARPGAKFLTDHFLSLIVFGGAAAEFLLWPRFASSTFFLLALLSLVDFLSGVALRTRRGAQPAPVVARAARQTAPAPPPQAESVEPVPPAPDHSRPKSFDPETAAVPPSPQVPSPELQPGNSAPPRSDAPPY